MEPAPADPVVSAATDEGESELKKSDLKLFGRAGQLALAMPGSGAQLGLDGVAYATASPEPRSGETSLGKGSRSFGTAEGEGGGGEVDRGPAPDPADYQRLLQQSLSPPPPARQLVLLDETWDAAPRQQSMWSQLDARRPLVPKRQEKCQRCKFKKDSEVGLHRSESKRWRLSDVIQCGLHTCPCCGRRKARVTSALLGVCFERHRELHTDGDHWMLTLSVPHRLSDGVARTNEWLYDACARFWDSRAWEHFAARWGVSSRVRVYDAVHGGANGTHPHFHVALFPTSTRIPVATTIRLQITELERELELERRARRRRKQGQRGLTTNAEREEDRAWEIAAAERMMEMRAMYEAALVAGDADQIPMRDVPQPLRRAFLRELVSELLPAWKACLKVAGCPHAVNSHAIDLLPSEKAETYFVKWGLAEEVGLSVEKDRSHLRLLDIVCADLGAQSDIAADLYRNFNTAMHGRTWVTGMADTCRRLGVEKGDVADYIKRMRERRDRELARQGAEPLPTVPELHLVVRAHLWGSFLALGHEHVFSWLDATCERVANDVIRVQNELDEFLWGGLALTSRSNTS
jgi:hypothetical protein